MVNDITTRGELMPALNPDEVVSRRNQIVAFTKQAMQDGVDYGAIPGTGGKPTLLKPGAEKLCTLFGLSATFVLVDSVKDWVGRRTNGEPLFYFEYKCQLLRHGAVVAEGDGNCNSWEKKYRFREAKRVCPDCGKATIIKGRQEYGGGWLCHRKQGGCGAKFFTGDQVIEDQACGQVANPEFADLVNTVSKMAQKRSLVAATLVAVNASEFFTQDMEDLIIDVTPDHTPPSRPFARR